MVAFLGTWLVDRVNIFFRLRRYIKMVAKRWVILAVCVVLGTAYATYRAVNSPNIYSASSRIGIAPKVLTPNMTQAQYLEELNSFYERNLDVLNSSRLQTRVMEKMRDHPATVQPFTFNRSAAKGPGSFRLDVESTDRAYARNYAKVWAQEFIKFKNEDINAAFGNKAASTRAEIETNEKKLSTAQRALTDFRRKHNLGFIKDSGKAAQDRLAALEQEYQDKKTLRQRLQNKSAEQILAAPDNEPAPAPPERPDPAKTSRPDIDPLAKFGDSSQYRELKLQLRAKESELERQIKILKPSHFYLARLQDEVNQIKQRLKDQLDLIEEQRRAQIQSLENDEKSYVPIINDLRKTVLESSNLTYEYERLQEDETNLKQMLQDLRRSEQSLSSTTTTDGNLTVLEEGTGPDSAVRPNRRNMILAGLFLGMGIGLGIIYLLGRLDDRLELADDIESGLGEQVLGQIPQVDRGTHKEENVLITKLDEHNMFSESIRHVRSAVMFGNQEGPKQALLVTSAIPGDGKTTVTVNFAVTLAIAGHKVLLVDADLRRGNIHSYFGIAREPGFAEVLLGRSHWSDVAQETEIKTLTLVTSGKLPTNPGELLISPITRQFVEEARESFDYIIFDCPPLTAIDDTFALVGQVDGLIFVVRSGHTSMRFAQNALEAVRQRGAKILGVVLNGITADNPYYYYRNYYHAYYSKGGPKGSKVSTDQIPAVTMAAPKNRQHKFAPISVAAKKLAGERVSPEQIAAEAQNKTEFFRRKPAESTAPSTSDDAQAGSA